MPWFGFAVPRKLLSQGASDLISQQSGAFIDKQVVSLDDHMFIHKKKIPFPRCLWSLGRLKNFSSIYHVLSGLFLNKNFIKK